MSHCWHFFHTNIHYFFVAIIWYPLLSKMTCTNTSFIFCALIWLTKIWKLVCTWYTLRLAYPNCPVCANLFLLEVRQQTETFRLSLWETKLKRDKETEAQKTGQTDWKWDSDHRKREREWSRVRQTQQERGRWLPCSETDKETTICRNNRQFTLGTQSCTQNKDKATDVQC